MDSGSLFHDFGVTGDDASELLQEFARGFDVDINGFPFDEYFGDESSFNPLAIIDWIFGARKRQQFKRLDVRDLLSAANHGVLSGK